MVTDPADDPPLITVTVITLPEADAVMVGALSPVSVEKLISSAGAAVAVTVPLMFFHPIIAHPPTAAPTVTLVPDVRARPTTKISIEPATLLTVPYVNIVVAEVDETVSHVPKIASTPCVCPLTVELLPAAAILTTPPRAPRTISPPCP